MSYGAEQGGEELGLAVTPERDTVSYPIQQFDSFPPLRCGPAVLRAMHFGSALCSVRCLFFRVDGPMLLERMPRFCFTKGDGIKFVPNALYIVAWRW